ncbi:MAG: hypothetical protein IPH05_12330 [Flavobacteriales bacterium]|nr:hypothetical protein [Flavobacteriales bacterium]
MVIGQWTIDQNGGQRSAGDGQLIARWHQLRDPLQHGPWCELACGAGSITRGGGNYAVQGLAPGLYTIYAISSEGEQQQGRLVV